jgi:hypothetical protein
VAYDFDGVNDVITMTIATPVSSGSWAAGGWFKPDGAGEGGGGRIYSHNTAGTVSHEVILGASSPYLTANQQSSATAASSGASTQVWVADTWTCIVWTFNASDGVMRIYYGSESVGMAEVSYSAQTAMTGTRRTGTAGNIGNRPAGDRTYDGGMVGVFMVETGGTTWAVTEAEAFRTHQSSVISVLDTTAAYFIPMKNDPATDVGKDGLTLTISGAVFDADTPTPWAEAPTAVPVVAMPLTVGTITVAAESTGVYLRRTFARGGDGYPG